MQTLIITLHSIVSWLSVSKRRLAVLLLLTLVGGLANTVVLAIINEAMSTGDKSIRMFLFFIGMYTIFALSQRLAQRMVISITERSLRSIRTGLIERVLVCKYAVLEDIGEERILACLTTDAAMISRTGPLIVSMFVSLFTMIACLSYLAYLSTRGFVVVVGFIIFGVGIYMLTSRNAFSRLGAARSTEDAFLKHTRDLLSGSKELKLNAHRREAFFVEDLQGTCAAAETNNKLAKGSYVDAELLGSGMFYLLIGSVVILSDLVFGSGAHLSGKFLIMLIFLMGPISTIVSNFPLINTVVISVRRLSDLSELLSKNEEASCGVEIKKPVNKFKQRWHEIRLKDVSYDYQSACDILPFRLGPVNLSIKEGEVLFLAGGNGSGKTTLGKIITGLYAPHKGMINVDGTPVEEINRDAFRQMFSAVYSNYHIFSKLRCVDIEELVGQEKIMLKRLQIADKIAFSDGHVDTNNLSQGEKKRLALALCFHEGRSVYFFDEWAADQDPVFKNYFYAELLPILKRAGKTIIAITHDDKYFHLADRVLLIENGELIPWKESDAGIENLISCDGVEGVCVP